jgi:hypothetical protein
MKTLAVIATFVLTAAVAQAAPQSWRFNCTYYNLDVKGHLSGRQRYSATYTRGLPDDAVRWTDVTMASASGWSDDFGPETKQGFMEGFSYPHADVAANMTKPDFFRGFPPMAMQQRNLVWDTHMLEGFAGKLDLLKPNVTYHAPENADVELSGAGTFRNHDLQLVLTGSSKRNGRDCAVIDYRAMFNTLDVKAPGFEMVGRSDYWGQIWVSLATKRIEYATLYEEVFGDLTLDGQAKSMTISVVRTGTFEPVGQ